MTESAIGLRERHRAETSANLKMTARRMTAEHGLAGFTIEELCEEVGVSRRTFFNYYASKERAVLGVPDRLDQADLAEEFVASTDPLVDALTRLYVARWDRMELSPEEIPSLIAAADREPRLVALMLELAGEGERDDILLVERREGVPAGDLRAAIAVQLLGTVLRTAALEAIDKSNTDSFTDIFLRRLAAARALLA